MNIGLEFTRRRLRLKQIHFFFRFWFNRVRKESWWSLCLHLQKLTSLRKNRCKHIEAKATKRAIYEAINLHATLTKLFWVHASGMLCYLFHTYEPVHHLSCIWGP